MIQTNSIVGAQLGSGCAEAQQPTLMRAIEESSFARQLAIEVRTALAEFGARLGGPEPEAFGNTTRECFGPGLVGELRDQIADVRDELNVIRELIRRLGKVA